MDHYQYNPESENQNNNSDDNNFNINTPKKKDNIATAALVCGIIAMPGILTVWFGIIFGIISIAFSIISRLNNKCFSGKAAAGLALGIAATVVSVLLLYAAVNLLNSDGLMNYLKQYTMR